MSLLMALLLVSSSFAKPVQSAEPIKVEGGLLQGTVEDGSRFIGAFLTQLRRSAISGGGLLSMSEYEVARTARQLR